MTIIAIYAGTFDPITNGHLDIIKRALPFVDALTVAVASNPLKTPMFTIDERLEWVKQTILPLSSNRKVIQVRSFDYLLSDLARELKAQCLIRGVRNGSDFDYEYQLASVNRAQHSLLETLFIPAAQEMMHISSRYVREIHSLGGNISPFVPQTVFRALQAKQSGSGVPGQNGGGAGWH